MQRNEFIGEIMKVLLLLAALSVTPLMAEDGACTMDVQKFCGEIQPGAGQVSKCLKDHVHELSPDCKNTQTAVKEKPKKSKKTSKKSKTETSDGN